MKLFALKNKNFVNPLGIRERILLLIVLFGLIFLFWYFIPWSMIKNKRIKLNQKIVIMTQNLNILKKQVKAKNLQKEALQKELQAVNKAIQLEQKNHTEKDKKNYYKSANDIITLLRNLSKEEPEIKLLYLQNKLVAKTDQHIVKKGLKEYDIHVKFTGAFFPNLHYLLLLEQLHHHIFWHELTYKVTKYPDAVVDLELHVITKK